MHLSFEEVGKEEPVFPYRKSNQGRLGENQESGWELFRNGHWLLGHFHVRGQCEAMVVYRYCKIITNCEINIETEKQLELDKLLIIC